MPQLCSLITSTAVNMVVQAARVNPKAVIKALNRAYIDNLLLNPLSQPISNTQAMNECSPRQRSLRGIQEIPRNLFVVSIWALIESKGIY